jgi:hypothetical protein
LIRNLKNLSNKNLEEVNRLKLQNLELEKSLKLKSVQTESQVSHPCYTAHSQFPKDNEEEEEVDSEKEDSLNGNLPQLHLTLELYLR